MNFGKLLQIEFHTSASRDKGLVFGSWLFSGLCPSVRVLSLQRKALDQQVDLGKELAGLIPSSDT